MVAAQGLTAANTPHMVRLVGDAISAGDLADAEQLLRMRLLSAPTDVGAISKLADLLVARKKLAEAAAQVKRAIAIAPKAHQLKLQLLQIFQQQAQFPDALAVIAELPDSVRSTTNVKLQEAALLGHLGRSDEEIILYRELLRELPRELRLWLSLANALGQAGRSNEAIRAIRRAMKIAPASGEPWWALANLKSFRFIDRDIAAMNQLLRGTLRDEDAIHLHFALGRAYEQRKDYARSFDQYNMGNIMRASAYALHRSHVTDVVDQAIAHFDAPFFRHYQGGGCDARDPIFIVGLHRSGSTLIEQILASHPDVEGTSELLAMQQLWDEIARTAAANGRTLFDYLADLKPADYRAIGEQYLERTRPFRVLGRPRFIDKLPANWINVGLIRLVLPNARIIDARRHPMACGFSNFKQLYAFGVTYTFSLTSIGRLYRDYLRLMNHFDEVQPGAIHHVVNERLIEDPEGELRRMLDYLGLPYDAACLDFHRNKRAVHTPSAEQVRRPINRDGVDAWRPYAAWLEPLREALGPALDHWLPAPNDRSIFPR